MGNDTRCPRCNRFGDSDLNNYCKACDLDRFKDELNSLCRGSRKILIGALLEVGAKTPEEVVRTDRQRVLNIVKRRQPINRRPSIVQDAAPLESHGMAFANEPTQYTAEKGVPAIEHE